MTEEKELQLVDRFPEIMVNFKNHKMPYVLGVQCENGWFDLIYDCLSKIEFVRASSNCKVELTQIKQKLGELVIYYDFDGEEKPKEIINDIVSSTNRKSRRICEVSGNQGTLCRDNDGRYLTISYGVNRNNPNYQNMYPISENINDLWKHFDNREPFQ
jgi:hypothetical protein